MRETLIYRRRWGKLSYLLLFQRFFQNMTTSSMSLCIDFFDRQSPDNWFFRITSWSSLLKSCCYFRMRMIFKLRHFHSVFVWTPSGVLPVAVVISNSMLMLWRRCGRKQIRTLPRASLNVWGLPYRRRNLGVQTPWICAPTNFVAFTTGEIFVMSCIKIAPMYPACPYIVTTAYV